MTETKISAELGGRILSFLVEVGESIMSGQEIALIESMKMEIPVIAPVQGTVSRLLVKPDDMVAEGDTIMIVSQ
jgi:acetyl-CoA carboxylase biotin carboxyl carrier protein